MMRNILEIYLNIVFENEEENFNRVNKFSLSDHTFARSFNTEITYLMPK